MKLSQKKARELYDAIYEPITQERIFLCKSKLGTQSGDARLFNLQNEIWRRVHKAIKGLSVVADSQS